MARKPPPVNEDDAGLENVTSQVEDVAALTSKVEELQATIEKSLRGTPPPKEEFTIPEGRRAFVAPAHPNGKFMVKPGKMIQAPSPNGPVDIRREGDVWARFEGSILITEDTQVIAWCENHSDICRDAFDPQTDIWASLIETQRETARKAAALPREVDVGKLLAGDLSGLGNMSSLAGLARRAASIGEN